MYYEDVKGREMAWPEIACVTGVKGWLKDGIQANGKQKLLPRDLYHFEQSSVFENSDVPM